MQIIDRIAERISKDNMSVLKLSNETGISAYKIYKWLDKKGNPKHDDTVKLEQWLSGKIEKVPHQPDAVASNGEQTYIVEAKLSSTDLMEILKTQIKLLEKIDDIEKRLKTFESSLAEVLSNQAGFVELLKYGIQRAAIYRYGADQKKLHDELHEINKKVGAVLK